MNDKRKNLIGRLLKAGAGDGSAELRFNLYNEAAEALAEEPPATSELIARLRVTPTISLPVAEDIPRTVELAAAVRQLMVDRADALVALEARPAVPAWVDAMMERRTRVENVLRNASKNGAGLDAEQCKALAIDLAVPGITAPAARPATTLPASDEASSTDDLAEAADDILEAANYLKDALDSDGDIYESKWLDPLMHVHGVLLSMCDGRQPVAAPADVARALSTQAEHDTTDRESR